MIVDGLKDYFSVAGVAEEPRILAGDDCSFKRRRRWLLLPSPCTPPKSRPWAPPRCTRAQLGQAERRCSSGARDGATNTMAIASASMRVREKGAVRLE